MKSKNSPVKAKPEEQNVSASPPHEETVAVPCLKDCVLQEVSVTGMDYDKFFGSLSDGSVEEKSDDDDDCYDSLLGLMLDPPGFGAPRSWK
jgi:hypothetical protein